ncbi:MAG TPA: hypothetical protein VNA88_12705 [Candidatus Kapabacteria bacterium]|jgi:hypothetical protein|nr:hypothetical protein [Candidatus Kapabacteria bacterium]
MALARIFAILATLILSLVALLQVLLAAGAPLGRLAWGGEHRILPAKLRLGSVAAIPLLVLAAWAILARVDLVLPGTDVAIVPVGTWIFGGLFVLNTLGNLASKSQVERIVMTPLALILAACFIAVSLMGR